MATYCLIGFLVIGLTHSSFVAYFSTAEDVVDPDPSTPYTDLDKKNTFKTAIAIFIQILFFCG